MANKQYEDWQLLHWLKDFAEELGKTPTLQEIDNEPSMPPSDTYINYFGSYNNAVRKAGLKVNYKQYTEKELLNKLKKFADKLGRAPIKKEIKKNENMPDPVTYKRWFISYKNACKKVGYTYTANNTHVGYSKNKLLNDLRKFALQLGRTPTLTEVDENQEIASAGSYTYHFGNYSNACKKAGLVPWEKGMKFDHLSDEEFQKRVVPSEKEKMS